MQTSCEALQQRAQRTSPAAPQAQPFFKPTSEGKACSGRTRPARTGASEAAMTARPSAAACAAPEAEPSCSTNERPVASSRAATPAKPSMATRPLSASAPGLEALRRACGGKGEGWEAGRADRGGDWRRRRRRVERHPSRQTAFQPACPRPPQPPRPAPEAAGTRAGRRAARLPGPAGRRCGCPCQPLEERGEGG